MSSSELRHGPQSRSNGMKNEGLTSNGFRSQTPDCTHVRDGNLHGLAELHARCKEVVRPRQIRRGMRRHGPDALSLLDDRYALKPRQAQTC